MTSAARPYQLPPAHGTIEHPNAAADFRVVQLWAEETLHGRPYRVPSTFYLEWRSPAGEWVRIPVIHRHAEIDAE